MARDGYQHVILQVDSESVVKALNQSGTMMFEQLPTLLSPLLVRDALDCFLPRLIPV